MLPTAYAARVGAPYVPSRRKAVERVLQEIELGANDTLIDLGSGDGVVVKEAAKRGARAIGYELSPPMWLIGMIRTWGQKNAHMRLGDFYRAPLDEATVLFAFLMPKTMTRLRASLKEKSLPNGKYLVSYGWIFEDVTPLKVVREPRCLPMYIYDLKELSKP